MSEEKRKAKAPPMHIKSYMEGPIYKQLREHMQAEINERKVDIDYSCFKKTPQEKLDLKQAKKAWKLSLK